MKTKFILSVTFCTLLFSTGSFSQCMMVEVPLSQRVHQSSFIMEGRVAEQSSYWNKAHTNIFTSSLVEVYKVFKGQTVGGLVEVITEGGVVGMEMERVEPELQLGIDQVGVFFLESCQNAYNLDQEKKSSANSFRAYAGPQGFILYDLVARTAIDPFHQYPDIAQDVYSRIESETGKSFTVTKPFTGYSQKSTPGISLNIAPSISSFSPTTISAGTASVLTINGSGFGSTRGTSTVKFKNADNGGTNYIVPDVKQYISWSDVQIKVQVPSWVNQSTSSTGNAGSGTIQVSVGGVTATSSSSLYVSYGVSSLIWTSTNGPVIEINCVDQNSSGGYTLQFNNSFASNAGAVAAFTRAFTNWKCASFVNWQMGANTSVNSQASDNISVIRFANSGELSAGTTARCNTWYGGCSPGGDVWFMHDFDLMYNPSINWNYSINPPSSSQNDFESTTLHELGHALLLTHVNQAADVMYWATSPGVMQRTLTADVIAGGNHVMTRAAVPQVCGPGAMTLLNSSNCATGINDHAQQQNEIEIFPNPSSGLFQIEGLALGSELSICNLMGEKLKEFSVSSGSTAIDLTAYPSGVYFLRVKLDDRNFYDKKLIKQ